MHTPKPWWVEVFQDGTSVESKNYTICTDVSNEDAALIAAAPELLEACKDALETAIFEKHPNRPWQAQAAAAIHKATGER